MKLGRRPIEAVNGHLQCKACGQIRPLEKFPVCKRAVCGRRSTCNLCRAETRRSTRVGIKRGCRKSPITAVGEKWCYKCNVVKPITAYGPNRRMKDGLCSECKLCRKEIRRKRHVSTYEGRLMRQAKNWAHQAGISYDEAVKYIQEIDRARKSLKAKARLDACNRANEPVTFQCEQCGKSITAVRKRKFCEDRCAWKSNTRHRKFMRRMRMGDKSQQDRIDLAMLLERDGFECGLCHERIHKKHKYPHPMSGTIDHIIPFSKGGTHQWVNVQAAHAQCNCRKRVKTEGQLRLC